MISSLWNGLFSRLRSLIRSCLTSIAIVMTGVLFIAAAGGLAVAGGFLWLSTQMPSHLAAFVVAGGLFLIGALILSVAILRNGNATAKTNEPDLSPDANAEYVSQQVIQVALAEATKAPIKAVFAAVALGVVVGLLRPKKSP